MSHTTFDKSFVPQDSKPMVIDRHTVYCYPPIKDDMSDAETTYGFMITKAAMESADASIESKIQAFGELMGTSPLNGIIMARYSNQALSLIKEKKNFEVLSYHSRNGKIINNCLKSDGTLKPVENATTRNRRPNGVYYVKLSVDLDFSSLDPLCTLVQPFSYFARLQMENTQVPDDSGTLVNLNTFRGPDDWANSTDQGVIDTVLKSSRAIEKPFNLIPPSITDIHADAQVEITKKWVSLKSMAYEAMWKVLCKKILEQLCPNVQDDPTVIIQGIHQKTTDGSGSEVLMTAAQYFRAISNMTQFFSRTEIWPIDVVQHFLTHLDLKVRNQMKSSGFSYSSGTATRMPFEQTKDLCLAFTAASQAEKDINIRKEEVIDNIKTNHVLALQVNASQCEDTLKKYKDPKIVTCWGCGKQGHGYSTRKGAILCPDKDKPGVKEKAEVALREFRGRRAKKNSAKTEKRALSSLIADVPEDQIRAFVASVKKSKLSANNGNFMAFLSLVCLNSSLNSKPLLPISVDTSLPHITLPIGPEDSKPDLALTVCYDSAAVLCVGSLAFHLSIAKKYPHVVKSLTWAGDKYTALSLTGIVSDQDKKDVKQVTTLNAVIEYYLKVKTDQGMDATMKVALGEGVGINTILGISMIKPAKLSLDLENEVVTPGVLKCAPFPVTFKSAIRSVPNFADSTGSELNVLTNVTEYPHVTEKCVDECITSVFMTQAKPPEVKVMDPNNPLDVTDHQLALLADKAADALNMIKTSNQQKALPIVVSKRPQFKSKSKKKPVKYMEYVKSTQEETAPFAYIYENALGSTLRKINLNDHEFPKPNPAFNVRYNPKLDKIELDKNLIIEDTIDKDLYNRIRAFAIEMWDVFRAAGVSIPISGYEMEIDTGDHPPIAVKNPRYGLHESVIMNNTIAMLYLIGHIVKDVLSPWGFRISLAPKPHQEEITDINDYVWRFCINYILLNQITRAASYPIPRCDDAVMFGFGSALFFILFDAFSGYHQIKLTHASSLKTAFYAPGGRKYRFVVMPFGPKNCPVAYVAMAHDLQEIWRDMCAKEGLMTDENEGSTIIIDDTLLFAMSVDNMFGIAKCVCIVARKYCLTWKLKKCKWFPAKLEFVGVDVSKEGNSPARSKFVELERWKEPTTARKVLAFIGFSMFYMRWIPFFEVRITPLRDLIRGRELDMKFNSNEFNLACKNAFKFVSDKILSSPILKRANIKKRFYLKTDFSSFGLGFALCQPDDSPAALAAMKSEDEGGECMFDLSVSSKLRLLLVNLGSRRTVGNEKFLHSHPGEALAAIFGITKNRPFLWGRPFTLMTDCRALMWLMTYKGTNSAVRRLQLEMLGYFFSIVHRNRDMLADADFMSYLSDDLRIDPLLKDYLSFARQQYKKHPPQTGDINQQNMPGRRKKAKLEIENPDLISANFATVSWPEDPSIGSPSTLSINEFENVPISFACNETSYSANFADTYSYLGETALRISQFTWCLYEPRFGHFLQTAKENSMNFEATLAIESDISCRGVLQDYWKVPTIVETLNQGILHLTSTPNAPKIQGYCANLAHTDKAGWNGQLTIIDLLRTISALKTIVIFVSVPSSPTSVLKFCNSLKAKGWKIHKQDIVFEQHSDMVGGKILLITGTMPKLMPANYFHCATIIEPPKRDCGFAPIINHTFNKAKHSIPYIGKHFSEKWVNEKHIRSPTIKLVLDVVNTMSAKQELGYQVFDEKNQAPLPSNNKQGLFGQLFGIIYRDENGLEQIRSISNHEYASTFGYDSNFVIQLVQTENMSDSLRHTVPIRTMSSILLPTYNYLSDCLDKVLRGERERLDMDLSTQALLNGIVPTKMPVEHTWEIAYQSCDMCKLMISMKENPSLINAKNLADLPPIFRAPMRESTILWENKRLIYLEPVSHSAKYLKLTIVPTVLQKLICIAFHVNPLGSHFSLYYTHHRIRLRYIWQNMWSYIKEFIRSCAACILATRGAKPGSELLYSFPLDAPFHTIHADCWEPGQTMSFAGTVALMIVMDHLTGFVAIEELKDKSSTSFTQAVYKIMLRYGIAQMIVTDADSKFKGEFKKMALTLELIHHECARNNHNPVLVERFNRFLNKSITIFGCDRKSIRVFVEGALMVAYAWNSAPVAATNMSRSLVVCGREFHFPIDFTSRQHLTWDTSYANVMSYADETLELLKKCREVYKVLIHEHRAYHRELRNAQVSRPHKYKKDDIVFTRVQVQSNKAKGIVKKLQYVTRGPYRVINTLKSGSYELLLSNGKSTAVIKKHGNEVYDCPRVITPHQHLDCSDHKFGSINKPVVPHPYELASIQGFDKSNPWETGKVALAMLVPDKIPKFPSVEELDEEIDSWPNSINPFIQDEQPCKSDKDSKGYVQGHTSGDSDQVRNIQINATVTRQLSVLINELIRSDDKLYFISYSAPNQSRKEWKLVRINLQLSMSKNCECLQDGRFLAEFFTSHTHDESLDFPNKRYWLEYHKTDKVKILSQKYFLISPTDIASKCAEYKHLVPYREYIQLKDPAVNLHGPFEFATVNGRKSRDRISILDWNILRSLSKNYDNQAPVFRNNFISIAFDESHIVETNNDEVGRRVTAFLGYLHHEDETLQSYL